MLIATPKIPGARYHWDFDDDCRTDEVTKTNRIRLPEDSKAPSACVRVLKRGTGTWARCSLESPPGNDAE